MRDVGVVLERPRLKMAGSGGDGNNRNGQQQQTYDMSKPMIDLYSFRAVRGDALTKYNSLNQSEPLRINLALFAAFCFASSPWLLDELAGLPAFEDPIMTAGAAAGAVASVGLFLRECGRRSRQLTRLEKELAALDLRIRLPTNALADQPYERDAVTVRQLQRQKGIRVVALYGNDAKLRECLQNLRVFGRRLLQSNTYVVPVSSDGDGGFVGRELDNNLRLPWLALPSADATAARGRSDWKLYFEDLSEGDSSKEDRLPGGSSSTFKWFGLRATGRSFASGQGSEPSWLQLLGRHLRPVDILPSVSESESGTVLSDDDRGQILKQQSRFYSALTSGNLQEMESIFINKLDEEVTGVVKDGGRLDAWKDCLADGARPEGLTVSDPDVTIVSDSLAFSTAIESADSEFSGTTLLAVQRWEKDAIGDGEDDAERSEWKLAKHQTIPWTEQSSAGGMLLCDGRGCVSLVRSSR